jgi:hypothetical protein
METTEHAYIFTVRSPQFVDPDTVLEIEDGREVHDHAWKDAVARWLGGKVNAAESALADDLPEGWSVTVAEVT